MKILRQKLDSVFLLSLLGSLLIHFIVVMILNQKGNEIKQKQIYVDKQKELIVNIIVDKVSDKAVVVKKTKKNSKLPEYHTLSNPQKPSWIVEIEDFVFTYGSIKQIEEETRMYSCPRQNINYASYGK